MTVKNLPHLIRITLDTKYLAMRIFSIQKLILEEKYQLIRVIDLSHLSAMNLICVPELSAGEGKQMNSKTSISKMLLFQYKC